MTNTTSKFSEEMRSQKYISHAQFLYLVDVSDTFFIFFLFGEGEGGVRDAGTAGGAGSVFDWNPRRGGLSRTGGAEGLADWGILWGVGGANFFVGGGGAEMSTKFKS